MVNKLGKRFFSVFLGIVALQIILPFVIFCATSVMHQYREAVMAAETSHSERYVTFSIKANDPDLVMHDNEEFSFRGNWYDIKEVALQDGTYTIVALADEHETTLQQLSHEHQLDSHDATQQVKKFVPFFFMYYQQHQQWSLHNDFASNARNFELYNAVTLSRHYKIIIPPPNTIA